MGAIGTGLYKIAKFAVKHMEPVQLAEAAQHKRLANIDLVKDIIRARVGMLLEVEKELRIRKASVTSPADAFLIDRQLNELGEQLRVVGTCLEAFLIFPEVQNPQDDQLQIEAGEQAESPSVAPWWDQFESFARRQNEDWRKMLLTRALALEAGRSGTISLRTLFTIGTFEESVFKALSYFLSNSVRVFRPNKNSLEGNDSISLIVPAYFSGKAEMQEALEILERESFFVKLFNAFVSPEHPIECLYSGERVTLGLQEPGFAISEAHFEVYKLTPQGQALARVVDVVPTEEGRSAFSQMISDWERRRVNLNPNR